MKKLLFLLAFLFITCTGPMGPAGEGSNEKFYKETGTLYSFNLINNIWEIDCNWISPATDTILVQCWVKPSTSIYWSVPNIWGYSRLGVVRIANDEMSVYPGFDYLITGCTIDFSK